MGDNRTELARSRFFGPVPKTTSSAKPDPLCPLAAPAHRSTRHQVRCEGPINPTPAARAMPAAHPEAPYLAPRNLDLSPTAPGRCGGRSRRERLTLSPSISQRLLRRRRRPCRLASPGWSTARVMAASSEALRNSLLCSPRCPVLPEIPEPSGREGLWTAVTYVAALCVPRRGLDARPLRASTTLHNRRTSLDTGPPH